VVGQSYNKKYRKIVWSNSISNYEKWKNGRTGFPVVDAGMRQLNETGYMHNRCRMICATFFIKILLLDWRLGEQYFATKLTDYDIASNNGNWQGISGTGVDMKPYFRTMNPWIQSKKFDPECEYIKYWVPELKEIEPKHIHSWYESWELHKGVYLKPIADYKTQTEKMMNLYSKA
jgi:deoxyribodipyrimidine photo-lyase